MRPEPREVHDLADGARFDELGGAGHRPHLESLREVDGPDAPGLRPDPLHLRELRERSDPRLVRHHVLAVAHRPHRDAGPFVRNRRGDDEVDVRILEQPLGVVGPREAGEALEEAAERLRIAIGPEPRARATEVEKPADLMVDVAMIEADRRESKRKNRHITPSRVFPRRLPHSFRVF